MYTNSELIRKGCIMINSLCVFTKLKNDEVIKKYKFLLHYLSKENIEIQEAINTYNEFSYELLSKGNGISLREYIINKLFLDNNPFTDVIDQNKSENVNILNQVSFELSALQYMCSIKARDIKDEIIIKTNPLDFEEEVIKNLIEFDNEELCINNETTIGKLKLTILKSEEWGSCLYDIIEFYNQYGTGEFGHYRAFVWECEENEKYLRGIDKPDPVRLEDLVGYEYQKETIIDNTKQFLNGYPANNLLLYGSRGTGKSSTVKAVINEYYNEGLRLIEVDKNKLSDFTKIIRLIKTKI